MYKNFFDGQIATPPLF